MESEHLQDPVERANFFTNLCVIHEECFAKDKTGLVQTYGSSCWLGVLEPSPPSSETSNNYSSGTSSSSSDSGSNGQPTSDVRPEQPASTIDPELFLMSKVVLLLLRKHA